jgi:hypothetical protein
MGIDGKLKLVRSPIQLRLKNKYKFSQFGEWRMLKSILMGVKTLVDLKVIEFTNEKDPYIVLLGIDWAFDSNEISNLK